MKLFCNTCDKIFSPSQETHEGMVNCPHCNKEIPMPQSKTSPGSVISDFLIEKFISKGGMGEVFEARQISLDRPVALKVIQERFVNDKEYVNSLIREARAAAKINHPNIVQAYSVGEDEGVYFFAMELVRGETFKEILKREKLIEPIKAAKVILDIASALAVAWKEQKLVHQDIKPDNIMLDANNFAKLADLGLARKAENIEDSQEESDEVMGTPQYISPEQLLGISTDIRSDIYSLGATFFHFVTGRFAYVADTAEEITRMHVDGNLEPPQKFNPNLPDELNSIIIKMMARNIEDRYQSAEELIEDLKAYLKSTDLPTTTSAIKLPSNSIKINKPTLGGAKITLPGVKPAIPGVKPAVPGAKPAVPGAKPTIPGAKPAIPGAKPAIPGAKPTIPGAKPAIPGAKPAIPGAKSTISGTKPASQEVKPATPITPVANNDATNVNKIETPVATPVKTDIPAATPVEATPVAAPPAKQSEETTEKEQSQTQAAEGVSIANSSQKEKALSKADEAAKAAAIAKKKERINKIKSITIKTISLIILVVVITIILSVTLYFLTKFEKLPSKIKPHGEKFYTFVNKKLGLEKKDETKTDNKDSDKENTLHKVGDHNGDLSAAGGKEQSQTDSDGQQHRVNIPVDAPEGIVFRQTAEEHEETDADRREDTIVDHTGDPGDNTGSNTEFAAVTHFIELRQRKTAGFTQTVGHPRHQRQNKPDGGGQHCPPGGGKTGLVEHFKGCHRVDHSETGDTLTDTQKITSGAAAGCQKVGGTVQETVAVEQNTDHQNDHSAHDRPVKPRHSFVDIDTGGCQKRIHFVFPPNFVLIKKDVLLFNYIGYKIAHQLQIIKFFSVYLSKKKDKKSGCCKIISQQPQNYLKKAENQCLSSLASSILLMIRA